MASVGLGLFFVGAVIAHLRSRVLHNIAFPIALLALAGGATVFFSFGDGEAKPSPCRVRVPFAGVRAS